MRNRRAIRFALLGMVSQNPEGIHGYALKRQCDRVLGHFWQLNFGEVYRVLDRLVGEGLLEVALDPASSTRKLVRITDRGQRTLDTFILEPPMDVPRPLRQELAVKLLFASADRIAELLQLIDAQRETYARQLHALTVQRRKLRHVPVDSFVVGLLIDGAEMSLRSEFAWLDSVSQKLKERFSRPRR